MSGIRSTLDIVMERTKNLTLSGEEKEKFRLDECRKKCLALVSRYLAEIIDAVAARTELDREMQECPEAATIFRQELIRAVDPWKEKETLAAGLKDILAIDPSPYVELVISSIADRDRLLAGETEKKLAALHRRGIGGPAVLPNMDDDPGWKENLSGLKASLQEQLDSL